MHRKSLSWRAALAVCACVAGCGSDPPPPSGGGCTPACSAGYACQGSACVAACNPACGAGESCVVRNGTSVCVTSEAGVPTDLGVTDIPLTDTGNPPPPPPPPGDSSVPPTDTPPGGDAGMCGLNGQACCGGRVCVGNGACRGGVCVSVTPVMGECTTTLTCAMGACTGFFDCGDRRCLQCATAGMIAAGAACTNNGECATGLCINGLCAAPCLFGTTAGDMRCASATPRASCVQLTIGAPADAGMPAVTTIGACLPTCVRDADCPTSTFCRLASNDAADRYDRVCGSPRGASLTPGMPCDPNPPAGSPNSSYCRNGQCVATGMRTGYCTAFCDTNADCPASAPRCAELFWTRPVSGTSQAMRACQQ